MIFCKFSYSSLRYMSKINAETQRHSDAEKIENWFSGIVIDAAIEVHKVLGGPGLLESIYEDALFQELQLRGIAVTRQASVPVKYKGIVLRESLRLDLLVGGKVIVEVKATENNHSLYKAQVLTYLRLTNLKLGLVLNFGQERLIDGLTRVANDL